jgi:hypothetical protein
MTRKNHSAGSLAFINRRLLRATGILNYSAGSLAFGYVSGGFGRHRGGRFNRVTRDFVPSPGG